MKKIVGNVICPQCKHKQSLELPRSSCQVFYKCRGCNQIISARKSCCIFCDYGDKKCPVAKTHKK